MPAQQAPTGDSDAAADDRDKPQPSLWERLDRPSPAPRTTLTPHRIAEAAVAIADTEGLDAVTMRRLATALGVAPMAAYRYVSGKDELIELMVDFVYGQLPLDTPADGWREAIGPYAEEGSFRSVADVVDPDSLLKVRETKREIKAAKKAAAKKD